MRTAKILFDDESKQFFIEFIRRNEVIKSLWCSHPNELTNQICNWLEHALIPE